MSKVKKEEEKFSPSGVFEGMVSLDAVIHSVEAGTSDRRIDKVLFDRERSEKKQRELAYIKRKQQSLGFELVITDKETIDGMCIGNSHGGIVALCGERSYPSLTEDRMSGGYYVMLDGIEDPYNFGYAVRSLYAAGVDGLIIPPRNWMSAAGVVCRASAGASERFPMFVAEDGCEAVSLLRAHGCKVLCADIDNSVSVYDADLSRPLFLIVGGEKRGISRSVLKMADAVVRLDYGRTFDGALSAASAASILAFEVYRQNR